MVRLFLLTKENSPPLTIVASLFVPHLIEVHSLKVCGDVNVVREIGVSPLLKLLVEPTFLQYWFMEYSE